MRLLFLSNTYPPADIGGFEQLCQEVTECLRNRGHTVDVLTSRSDSPKPMEGELGVHRRLYLQANQYHYQPLDFFLRRPREERSNGQALRQAIEALVPDIVVVWGMWNLSRNLPFWAEEWLPDRVAHYIASYWPTDQDIHLAYWSAESRKPVTRLLMRPMRAIALETMKRQAYPPNIRFEHAMCCSEYVRNALVNAGALPETAGVLHVGIDPHPFLAAVGPRASADHRLRMLYAGSLSEAKGVHTAIEALGALKEIGMIGSVELTVLGGGHPEYEQRLHRLAETLGVSDRVNFAGRVRRDDVPQWLHQSDVFLFTSMWAEPMARSVMEAMASGKLVIGAEVGGQTEMMRNGENSLTFAPGDYNALASHISRAIQHPTLRVRLAEAGRQTVLQHYTLERMVTDFEAWLNRVF